MNKFTKINKINKLINSLSLYICVQNFEIVFINIIRFLFEKKEVKYDNIRYLY